MKKMLFILVLAVVIAGGVFGQAKAASSKGKDASVKNFISGELGLIEFGARYERMLNKNFSVGGTAFWNSFFFFWNSLGIQATGRYYPWAGTFYTELGLGYGTVTGTESDWLYSWVYVTQGLMVTPEL